MQERMERADNIAFAKRNIVDTIYKEAKLEGVGGTFLDTKIVYEGGVAQGLKVDEIVLINNLKHAWAFVLETIDVPVDLMYIRHLNGLIGSNLYLRPGEIRLADVSIGGTTWTPELPDQEQIKPVLNRLYSQEEEPYSRILGTFAKMCRGQWFYDANKRIAQLVANKELIANGLGIFVIPEEKKYDWEVELLEYYEKENEKKFLDFLLKEGVSILSGPLADGQPVKPPKQVAEIPSLNKDSAPIRVQGKSVGNKTQRKSR